MESISMRTRVQNLHLSRSEREITSSSGRLGIEIFMTSFDHMKEQFPLCEKTGRRNT